MVDHLSLTDWAQIISAVGTLAAAVVAVVAAKSSYESAKQNNETNEQMIRPRVVVMVRSVAHIQNFIDMVVLNDGGGLARDVQLTVLGDDLPLMHQGDGEKVLSQLKVFSSGIKILPSKSERKYFMLSFVGQYEEILKKTNYRKTLLQRCDWRESI